MLDLGERLPAHYRRGYGRRGWIARRYFEAGDGPRRRRLAWRRLWRDGAVLAGVFAVAGLLGVYAFMRFYRGIAGTRLADLAWPPRWQRFERVRGEHEIAQAQRWLAEKRYEEAYLMLGRGLTRSPTHQEGRLLLVSLCLAGQQHDRAQRLLLEGLPHHGRDASYLRRVFALLLARQEDQQVLELAEQVLRERDPPAPLAGVCLLAAATAAYLRGDDDRAEDFLRRPALPAGTLEARLLQARLEFDRGFAELGGLLLQQLAAEFPRAPEVQHEHIAHLRRSRRHDEARRASLAFRLAAPELPHARVELLRSYFEAGEHERAAREAADFLREFARTEPALTLLGEFAAGLGEIALTGQLAATAAAEGFAPEVFAAFEIEARLTARRYDEAAGLIREWRGRGRATEPRFQALLDGFEAVVQFAQGDAASGRLMLASFAQRPHLRAENLLALANRLAAIEAPEAAREALARAIALDPRNQPVLTRLVEFELALHRTDALPAHLVGLLAMRRPSPDVMRVAQRELGSDLYLFSPEAEDALTAIREAWVRLPGAVARR